MTAMTITLLFSHYIFIHSSYPSCFWLCISGMIINTFQARLVINIIAIPNLVLFEMSLLLFLHSMTTSSFLFCLAYALCQAVL